MLTNIQTNMGSRKSNDILLTWPIMWLVWPSRTPHLSVDFNPTPPFLLDNFFDGEDLGCKTTQSTPSTLWIWGAELANVLFVPNFLDGVGAVWNLDGLDPHTQPKSIFSLERECALTSCHYLLQRCPMDLHHAWETSL
jgi:hypothetical protein